MFLQVTQVFDLRHLIGGTAQATVFQAGFCLLIYNLTVAIRGYVAETAGVDPAEVSLGLLFEDLRFDLTAWSEVIGPDATADVLAATPLVGVDALRQYLRRIVSGVWEDRWGKATTRARAPKGPPRAYLRGGHSSVAKILRGEHVEVPLDRGNPTTPPPAEIRGGATSAPKPA